MNHSMRRQTSYLVKLFSQRQEQNAHWDILLFSYSREEVVRNASGVVPIGHNSVLRGWSHLSGISPTRYEYRVIWESSPSTVLIALIVRSEPFSTLFEMYQGYDLLGEPFNRLNPIGRMQMSFNSWNDIPVSLRPQWQ